MPLSNTATHSLLAVAATTTTVLVVHRFFFNKSRRSQCPPFPPVEPVENPLKRGLKKSSLPKQADAIVVGAGPSGLATASLLTQRGYKVLVLEQHDRAGGGLHSFVEKGKYEFDTGFHYCGELGPNEPLKKIVDHVAGKKIDWSPIGDCPVEPGIFDQVHFLNQQNNTNGTTTNGHSTNSGTSNSHKEDVFNVPVGKEQWVQELKREFPDEMDAIDAYIKDMDACAKTMLVYSIWRSLPFQSFLSRILKPFLAWPAISHNSQIASDRLNNLTSNERLKAVLGYLSMGCCAVPPNQINYAVFLGLHAHFCNGAYYPVQGPASIATAMVQTIEKHGGRVLVRAGVDRVLVQNGKVAGVQLVKEELIVRAPVVISTIGLRETVQGLLRKPKEKGPDSINSGFSGKPSATIEDPLPQRPKLDRLLQELPWGKGHIYGFVGIRHDPNTSLNLPKRNCWFLPSYNLTEGWEEFQTSDCQNGDIQPFGYVGLAFPSEKDHSYKERYGKGVVTAAFVAGDVPWEWFQEWEDTRVHKRGDKYDKLKQSFQQQLLDILYMKYPQVKGKVDLVELGSPVDTRTYLGRLTGASYGIPPTVAKTKADATWLQPKMAELMPVGMYLGGQDVAVDGFAPAILSGLMVTAAIEGVLAWLDVVPMLGGWIETAKVL